LLGGSGGSRTIGINDASQLGPRRLAQYAQMMPPERTRTNHGRANFTQLPTSGS
jgi:hypothetical protein